MTWPEHCPRAARLLGADPRCPDGAGPTLSSDHGFASARQPRHRPPRVAGHVRRSARRRRQPHGSLEELHKLLDDPLTGFPAQASSLAIRHLSEACRLLGDSARANALLPHVEPWAGQILVVRGRHLNRRRRRPQHRTPARHPRPARRRHRRLHGSGPTRTLRRLPTARRPNPYRHARALLERGGTGDRDTARALLDDVINVTERLGMALLARQAIEARVDTDRQPASARLGRW